MGRKLRMTFKDPDAVYEAFKAEQERCGDLEEPPDMGFTDEGDRVFEGLRAWTFADDYITIEVDVDEGTATVIKPSPGEREV